MTIRTWWKEAVVYQIYPRSFMDSNGDGIGDLRGIIQRLDYLATLGVDVLWISPFFKSPNDDNGYDISDYREIMADFGTMADCEELIAEAHNRRIKIMMDLVVNHSSDEHPWFQEARKSKESPYREYYYFRPPGAGGSEPNNWLSYFSGPAWELDSQTGEYYLHLFTKRQPDLNWENPSLRAEVYAIMKWWIEKGIDGFRLDVINAISKVPGLPSVPGGTGYKWGGKYFLNGPRVHEFLQEMNREVLSHHDLITVGETGGVSTHDAVQYANAAGTELNMVFQFEHTDVDSIDGNKWDIRPWSLVELKQIFSRWQKDLYNKAWNSLYFTNHDQPRALSRFGDDVHFRVESATMLATYLHGQGGTPYIYQGEEIGMTNMVFHSLDEYKDVEIHNFYKDSMQKDPSREAEYMEAIAYKGRDNARTPMQWDGSPHGGFTTGEPWIRVNPNFTSINAAAAVADPGSIYHYYRALIALRKRSPVMVYGTYTPYLEESDDVAVYARSFEGVHWLVISNFREMPYTLGTGLPAWAYNPGKREIGNYADAGESITPAGYTLRPYEALIVSWRS